MSAENTKKESRTDWSRVNAMKDEEIDLSESPELGADFFKEAVAWPAHKKQITLRLDPEVLEFFRSQGRGYQTAINKVLRRYVETQKHHR
jgi:uncharacterized protein (DUF4415 family)